MINFINSFSAASTRIVDILLPWRKLERELASRLVELERLQRDLKRVRDQREKLRRELEGARSKREKLRRELEGARSKRESVIAELGQVRDQREKLRRDNEFLDYLVKVGGTEKFYESLEEIKSMLLSQTASFVSPHPRILNIQWVRQDQNSWLARNLGAQGVEIVHEPLDWLIEYIAQTTNDEGALALWNGYGETCRDTEPASRMPNDVRIGGFIGSFFTWLTRQRGPNLIVEIGTAFGVSGMYWTAGLEMSGKGCLVTFEPNTAWQSIAARNISIISSKFRSICGTVEECAATSFEGGETIDILFIDAIHTDAVVHSQLELLKPHLSQGALVLIDDINFSDDMKRCWQRLSVADDVLASVEIKGRIGILEY